MYYIYVGVKTCINLNRYLKMYMNIRILWYFIQLKNIQK